MADVSALPAIEPATETEALFRFLQLAPMGLAQVSSDGAIAFINPAAARLLTPLTRAGVLDNLFAVLEAVAPDLRQAAAQFAPPHGMVREAMRLSPTRGAHDNGLTHELTLSLVKLDRSRFMAVIAESGSVPLAEPKTAKPAGCDRLTGLADRPAFTEAAEREFARYRRSPLSQSMLLFNVDGLAAVNVVHGHEAGDAVLRNLAANLSAGLREPDLVARIFEHEFALLLPATGLEGAYAAANRLRRTIESQSVIQGSQCIRYTISGGIAAMDAQVADLEALMRRARHALSAAKAGGRNRVESW
jgi:diguanylate cyclase (GGDEF)-like protein